MIVAGILTRLGFEVGLACTKGGPYDLWLAAYEKPGGGIKPLRVQVRTISKGGAIKFTGGTRGGVNRVYIPDEKKYKYSERDNDLIIGIDPETLDLYLIPTRFLQKWGESRSVDKLRPLKNNWKLLLNWNDRFLARLEKRLPP